MTLSLRFFHRYLFLQTCLILASGIPCLATEGVVTHRATLRSDPSTDHKPLLVLQAGEDVEILAPTPTSNYYHVRTTEGTDGWVYASTPVAVAT